MLATKSLTGKLTILFKALSCGFVDRSVATVFRNLAWLVLAVLIGACTGDRTAETPADNIASDSKETMLHRHIEHDGIEREYFVHVPEGAKQPLPVVIAIHGYTSTATGFEAAHNLNPHSDEHGYIIIYPQGSHFTVDSPDYGTSRITSWNDLAANLGPKDQGPHCIEDAYEYPCPAECGSCDRCAWTSCYDDVGFVEKILDEVATEFPTDTKRYYLLGVSNGGMMALRLACNLSDRFAAVAPIIAQLAPGYACGPTVDLPMLHLYGAKDNTVRYDGLPGGDGFIYTTATETAAIWASAMSCNNGPVHWENEYSRNAGLTCTAHSNCRAEEHLVVSCMDPEGLHEWPGQRVESIPATCVSPQQYDTMPGQARCPENSDETVHEGMDLVWDFFSRYRTGG